MDKGCPLWGCAQAVYEVKTSSELKIMFISSHVKQTNNKTLTSVQS